MPVLTYTAFCNGRQIATGALAEIVTAIAQAASATLADAVQVFTDSNGEIIELDLRGSPAEIVARHHQPTAEAPPATGQTEATQQTVTGTRGRPRLGVVPREVTLLPRHWQWLSEQPGGASVALRKLVEQARKQSESLTQHRHAQEAAYRFLTAIAGNLPDYEEALRALFAGDRDQFASTMASWPPDIGRYAQKLAFNV